MACISAFNRKNWDFGGEDTVEGRISTNDGLHSVLVKLALAERNVGLHSVERLGIHNGQLSFQGSLDSIETSASLLAIDHVGHDTSMLVLYPGVGWELRGNRGRLRHDEFYFSDYEYDPLNRLCKLEYLSLEPGFKDTLGLRYDFMAGAITTDDPLHADGGLYVGGPSSIEAEGPLHIGTTSGGNAVGREHDPMGLRLSDEAENWELHGSGTVNAHVALSPDRVSWAAEDESGGTSFAIDMIPGLSTMEVHGSAEVFGNVNVLGELTAGIKLFRIDHPLDPENKYLQHSCVEGPERINVYNGTVVTDEKGFAEVQMPDYFMALNRDFEYQLTVIGRTFARAVVWEEMSEQGTFLIRSEEPDLKVSWMVTGIRNDELARQNPFEVEVAKN